MKDREKLEEALQLLLKLSNNPHFFYVEEVKEIAKLIHGFAQQSKEEPKRYDADELELSFIKWLGNRHVSQLDKMDVIEFALLHPVETEQEVLSRFKENGLELYKTEAWVEKCAELEKLREEIKYYKPFKKSWEGLVNSESIELQASQEEVERMKQGIEKLIDFMNDGTTGADQMVNLPLNLNDVYNMAVKLLTLPKGDKTGSDE